MNWEDWITKNKSKLEHVAGFEEQFVRSVLTKIPSIEPKDVIPQYHFKDSSGGNRFIDFMIINEKKGYLLPIELDGKWKVNVYHEFNDMLKRQNDLVKIYGILLRYTNKTMLSQPQSIIDEIKHTLELQSTNQLSKAVAEKKNQQRFKDYENELESYKNQIAELKGNEQKKKEQDAALVSKVELKQLQETLNAIQKKVEQVEKTNEPISVQSSPSTPNSKITPETKLLSKSYDSSYNPNPKKNNFTYNQLFGICAVILIATAFIAYSYFRNSGDSIGGADSKIKTYETNSSVEYQNRETVPYTEEREIHVLNVPQPASENTTNKAINTPTELVTPANKPEPTVPTSSYEAATSSNLNASEAYKYIGSYRIVCGKVAQVKEFRKGTYLNLGATYPNQDATIVVWNSDKGNFGNLEDYKNDRVCVEGTIDSYKGTPQIKLASSNKIN